MLKNSIFALLILILSGCGGGGGSGGGTEPVATNLAPTVTGDQAVEVLEGVQLTNAYSASDPENADVTLSLAGTDAAAFTLSSEGNLRFIQVPDFEAPADGGADNVYNLTIVASDSVKETSYTVAITVSNATEGRVVDGPVAGASVHIDLNGDGIQDANESVVLTDAEGNYSLPAPATLPASIVSMGGTDTQTGKVLENIVLVSEIRSASAPVAITPLTTVLVGIESEADQAAFLISLGLGSSLDDVLSADGWAAAESGDADAQAAQRVSQQIATAMQAISNVIEGSADAGTSAFDISKIVAAKIAAVAQSAEGIDLASAESMQSIIVASVNEVVTDGSADADVLAAIATSIASVNDVIADVTIDPTSASAADIVKSVQEDVQSKIVSLASGEITAAAFTDAVKVIADALAVIVVEAPDGDKPNTGSNVLSGKVIDGYISGATIYLDTNFNGIRDNNEIAVTSSDLGSFEFSLTDNQKDCLAYAPVRVDVPVGAVDADLGTVTSAFTMVLPPTFGFVESPEQLNVTPLTSVLWDEIEGILKEELGNDLTCENVKANIASLASFQESLSTSIANVVRHYNIPADKIFADYIAEGNSDLSTKAELIVKGLKKSFAETAELRENYPQAGYAEVNYFVFSSMDGDDLYPNAWYRETAYQDGLDTFVELKKISDDLETDIRLIYQSERSGGASSADRNLAFGLNKEIESRGGDDSGYSCNYQERITYTQGTSSYELINLTSYAGVSNSLQDCSFESFAQSSQSRYVFWNENSSELESQGTQFTFDFTAAKDQLPGWTDYNVNLDNLVPQAVVTYVNSLPKQFCENGLAGANSVYRSKKYLDGDVEVTIVRANDGSYSETRSSPDGTQAISNYLKSENPTINGCTTIDTDGDGVNDYYDAFLNDPAETLDTDTDGIGNNSDDDDDNDGVADIYDGAPLDSRISFISTRRDIDGDGVPDANDPDKDNDGFNNDDDAFPLDDLEWSDTDGDGVGNNADEDDDGDGLLDSADEFPTDPNNVLDDDSDGVANRFDFAPNDSSVDTAIKLNFDGVTSLGVSEAISSETEVADRNETSLIGSFFAILFQTIIPSAVADSLEDILKSANNLIALALSGEAVDDVVLASKAMFVAETVLSPDGRYLFMLTGTSIQSRLPNANLPTEICQLYRVDLKNDDSFECIVSNEVDFEINTISISNSLRDDYRRKGITFRADGTGLLQVHTKQLMIFPDGSYEIVSSGKTAPSDDYQLEDELGFWLDDEHYAISGSIIPLAGGSSESFFVVKNIITGEVVDENDPGIGLFVQQGNKIYAMNNSYEWNGTTLISISQLGQSVVQDYYGNIWAYDESGLDDSKSHTLTDSQRNISIPLSEKEVRRFASDNQSGTGTDIKYKQYDFKDNYVLHKYAKAPATPITSVNGVAYDGTDESLTRRRISLGGNLGYLWVSDQASPWGYFKSGNETSDVAFNYTVNDGGTEATKTFNIPLEAIQNHSEKFPEIKVPPESGYLNDLEPFALFFPTPESEQITFCNMDILSLEQRCAELDNFEVLSWDFESRRNDKYFPDEYYVCPGEDNCNAFPGVLQVLFVGDYIHAYFKDSIDNTYYLAKSSISDFMENGDSALTITSVVNGAGESEILAGANRIQAQAFGTLSGVIVGHANHRITLDFNSALNKYADLPEFRVVDTSGQAIPLAKATVWTDARDRAQIYLASSAPSNEEVTVVTDDWLFLTDSAERYAFPEGITATVSPSQYFVLDNGMETVVTDFVAANNTYVEIFSNLEISNSSAEIDLVNQPLDGQNVANLLASNSSAHVSQASIPIRVLPVGQGAASITIQLYAGDDGVKDTGERYAELSFDVNWEADGTSALFRVPPQDVSGLYITAAGVGVEISIENFNEDVIGLTSGGVNYPSSLDIRFMQVLNKVSSVLPTNILANGQYTAVVNTDLPIVDQDGISLSQLIVKFRIGD